MNSTNFSMFFSVLNFSAQFATTWFFPLQSLQSHGMFCSLLNKENTYVNKNVLISGFSFFFAVRIDSRLLYDKQSFHCTEKIRDRNIFPDFNLRDSQFQIN